MKFFLAFVFTFLFTLNSFSQDSTFVFKRQLGLSLESGIINEGRSFFLGNNYEIGGSYEERFNTGFALVFDLGLRYKALRERESRVWHKSSIDTISITRFYDDDRTGLRMAASVNAKIYYSNTKKLAVFMLLGLGVEQQLLQIRETKYLKSEFRERGTNNVTEIIEQNVSPPEWLDQKVGPEIFCGFGIGYKKTSIETGLTMGWTDNTSMSYYYGFILRRQISDFRKKIKLNKG